MYLNNVTSEVQWHHGYLTFTFCDFACLLWKIKLYIISILNVQLQQQKIQSTNSSFNDSKKMNDVRLFTVLHVVFQILSLEIWET